MRVHRGLGEKPVVGFGSVLQVAIVIGGVVAVGLLVAAHPVTGAVLVVAVSVLALLFGRTSVATLDEPPPAREGDEEPRP
jgi:hypothetical protein